MARRDAASVIPVLLEFKIFAACGARRATRYNEISSRMPKTFYIETFGCQMNVHDSEKVIGTLIGQGYAQVETPEEAELVFYNTCSIRDKAEQKVFHRLQQFKREHGKAKTSAALASAPPHAAHKT